MPDDASFMIQPDDPARDAVRVLIDAHHVFTSDVTPPEFKHALDIEALRQPDIAFWSLSDGDDVLGCGAMRELDPEHGEIKSMHTAAHARGRGVGMTMLEHILAEAESRGYTRVSLETGSNAPFEPARALYARRGFEECAPFGDYKESDFNMFMTLELT